LFRGSEMKFAWWADPHMRQVYVIGTWSTRGGSAMSSCPTPWTSDLFGDGSIVCMHTPGHTPGHQSAMVDVTGRDRKVILCGDACYLGKTWSTASTRPA